MEKRVKRHITVAVLYLFILGGMYVIGSGTLAGFAIFLDNTEGLFDTGTLDLVFYNATSSSLRINETHYGGNYTSEVFNANQSAIWNNISWVSSAIGELPPGSDNETKWGVGNANMDDIFLLMRLDEGSADSAPGGADFEDLSGNNRHGNDSMSGGITYEAAGKFGSAATFNGSGAVSLGYLNMSGVGDLTISVWAKTSSTADQRLVAKDQVGVQGAFILYYHSGAWKFQVHDGTSWTTASWTTTAPNDGEWHHFVGRVDTTQDKIKLDVDGENVNQASGFTVATIDDSDDEELVIGADSDIGAPEQGWIGEIDEVAIWTRAMLLPEIDQTYRRGANRLNLSVRSCDDSACSGESFTDITNTSDPQTLSVDNNQYFQYKFEFLSDNASISPELFNVTLDYTLAGLTGNITSPSDGATLDINSSIDFNYTTTNTSAALDSCWYTLDGGTTNVTVASCANTTFNVANGDADYTVSLYLNDTDGNSASDTVNFTVSASGVVLSVTEPTGTKTSRTEIPVEFSALGNGLTCWYNVYRGSSEEIANTTTSCTADTSFNVTVDADFTLNLFANNTIGVENSTNIDFTVDTTVTPAAAATSSGGGGGGGSSIQGILKKCEQNWSCTEWSECVAGEQTRVCEDLNSCNNMSGMPTETFDCSGGSSAKEDEFSRESSVGPSGAEVTGRAAVSPLNLPNPKFLIPTMLLIVLLIALLLFRKVELSDKMRKVVIGLHFAVIVLIVGLLVITFVPSGSISTGLVSFMDKAQTPLAIVFGVAAVAAFYFYLKHK